MIGKTKIATILFLAMLLGTNFISVSSVTFEDLHSPTDIENYYDLCGAYPLGDEIEPSVPPSDLGDTPDSFDWRNVEYNGKTGNWLTPVHKQGTCGSCWAFAAIAAIEAMVNIQRNDPDIDLDLSEQHLVSCCRSGCNGCRGGNSYRAWEYLMDNGGAILESCFPYEAIDSNGCDDWQSSNCNEDPVTCDMKCENWDDFTVQIKDMGYYYDSDPSLIKYMLSNHGPVVTYMLVYSDFKFYQGGVYRKDPYASFVGGHAVIIVGYDEEGDYLICKNSAGTNWGEDGYFYIEYGECSLGEQIYYVEIDETQINFPPNACAGGLYKGDIDEAVSFSSQESNDFDDDIESYLWDFGDGASSTDPNPTHIYSQKGIYQVTLTVTDSAGKQDVDETAVFIDLWEIGNSWTYKMNFNTIENALYPPIKFPFDGEITDLTLTVTEENDESYVLDFSGSLKGDLSFVFDIEKSILDFRMWSKIKRGTIEGSIDIDKKGFGLNEYELRLKGLANSFILPILPLPLWIPVPFDITMKKTLIDSRPLMSTAPELGKTMYISSSNSSSETSLSLFFGIISKVFQGNEINNEKRYTCMDLNEITTPSGIYECYEYVLDSSDPYIESEFYYSPEVNNLIKFSGADTKLYSYSGELISTNV
jgi:C1A family cysteine protease